MEQFSLSDILDSFMCGDSRSLLQGLPGDSVDMVICSPPYFQQRDYGADRQIGNEPSTARYVDSLLDVFKECQRVLKPSGSLWLNLGDKYQNGRLQGMPWRVALALQDRQDWILRSDIIWHKPNAMPSSVATRPTTDHEYVFLFSKSAKYFYDADSIREPHVTFTDESKMRGGRKHLGMRNGTPEQGKNRGNSNLHSARWDQAFHPKGRNRRTVWSIPLSKFPDAHFAVFPEKLVELCILAGSPIGGVVLDPFMGSGTTAIVATKLHRHFVGIDVSEEYCKMAEHRLRDPQKRLPFA